MIIIYSNNNFITKQNEETKSNTLEQFVESHETLYSSIDSQEVDETQETDEENEKSDETDEEVDKTQETDEENEKSDETDEEVDETQETNEENEKSDETDEKNEKSDNDNLTFSFSIDPEDYCETTLDDAINDKLHLPNTEWPNEIYREFMEIIMEFRLSNSCSDRIIKLVNKSRNSKNGDLLPKNTKKGNEFLDASDFPYMKFKKAPITKFHNIDYNFYYQPIIDGI